MKLTAAQKKLVDEAKAEMKALVELGCDRDVVPPDITDWLVRLLKAQRVLEEENLKLFADLISQELKILNQYPQEFKLLISAFEIADTSNDFWYRLGSLLLMMIKREHKNRESREKWDNIDGSL